MTKVDEQSSISNRTSIFCLWDHWTSERHRKSAKPWCLAAWTTTNIFTSAFSHLCSAVLHLGKLGLKKAVWKARIRTHSSRNTPIVGNIRTLIFPLSSIRCGFTASILDCICLWKKWMISLFLDLYSSYIFKAVLAVMWWACIWNSCHRLSIIL